MTTKTGGQKMRLALMQEVAELNEEYLKRDWHEEKRVLYISMKTGLSPATIRRYLRDMEMSACFRDNEQE